MIFYDDLVQMMEAAVDCIENIQTTLRELGEKTASLWRNLKLQKRVENG